MASCLFLEAVRAFDAIHNEDPNTTDLGDGTTIASELLYTRRLVAQLVELEPSPSETLALAANCQHLKRWSLSRSTYPLGRSGYKAWRSTLAKQQAELAGEILHRVGYASDVIEQVKSLVQKRHIRTGSSPVEDSDAQTLEDVACIVFIRYYLSDFAAKHARSKTVSVLSKTWAKMSPRGRDAALGLNLPISIRELLAEATGANISLKA